MTQTFNVQRMVSTTTQPTRDQDYCILTGAEAIQVCLELLEECCLGLLKTFGYSPGFGSQIEALGQVIGNGFFSSCLFVVGLKIDGYLSPKL